MNKGHIFVIFQSSC